MTRTGKRLRIYGVERHRITLPFGQTREQTLGPLLALRDIRKCAANVCFRGVKRISLTPAGPRKSWIKVRNPKSPAYMRFADWTWWTRRQSQRLTPKSKSQYVDVGLYLLRLRNASASAIWNCVPGIRVSLHGGRPSTEPQAPSRRRGLWGLIWGEEDRHVEAPDQESGQVSP